MRRLVDKVVDLLRRNIVGMMAVVLVGVGVGPLGAGGHLWHDGNLEEGDIMVESNPFLRIKFAI